MNCFGLVILALWPLKLVQLFATAGQNSKPFSPTKPKPNANAYVDQNTQTELQRKPFMHEQEKQSQNERPGET